MLIRTTTSRFTLRSYIFTDFFSTVPHDRPAQIVESVSYMNRDARQDRHTLLVNTTMERNDFCCEKRCLRCPRTVVDGRLRCGCYSWCKCYCVKNVSFDESSPPQPPARSAAVNNVNETTSNCERRWPPRPAPRQTIVPLGPISFNGSASLSTERQERQSDDRSSTPRSRVYDNKPDEYAMYKGIRCRCGEWLSNDSILEILSPCGHQFCQACARMFDRCFTCHTLINDRVCTLARSIF